MNKFIKNDNILDIKREYKNLIYYNVVFYHHNEPIEIMSYYMNNLKFLFNNIYNDDNKNVIEFCINFFVSDLDKFINLLKSNKFINSTNHKINYHKIYENNDNFIETKFTKLKPINQNFDIYVHEIISKPYKNIDNNEYNNIIKCNNDKDEKIKFDNSRTIINSTDINDGSKSIGFKRYVANIMSWNIYENFKIKNNENKLFNKIKVFLFQIDYGTIIGLHILLHPLVIKIKFNNDVINLLDNNSFNILSSLLYADKKNIKSQFKNFNYWNESKKFLISQKNIYDSYNINEHITNNYIETLYSNHDFFYFIITHLDTVIENFNIVHFTTLNIQNIKKNISFNLGNNSIKINTIPNKPNSYFDEQFKLYKQHYDKFYITDIGLTYIYQSNTSKPITYNKNYTSFSEDLLYTSLLYKLKKLIIPHPFLNITKCVYNKNIQNKSNDVNKIKYELIYIFLPTDDIGNYKIFDIINYKNDKKHNVGFVIQNEEINEFINNTKINKTINKNTSDNLILDNKNNIIFNESIRCSVDNKTNTNIYIKKYENSKKIFDFYNNEIINKFKIKNTLLVLFNDLIIVFNSNTNLDYYEKIISHSNIIIDFYNDKYNFYNNKYKTLQSIKIINNFNKNIFVNNITIFIYNYFFDMLWIINHMKKYDGNSNDNINNIDKKNNYIEMRNLSYKLKYFKYKLKYANLKKNFLEKNIKL